MASAASAVAPMTTKLLLFSLLCLTPAGAETHSYFEDLSPEEKLQLVENNLEAMQKSHTLQRSKMTKQIHANEDIINESLELIRHFPKLESRQASVQKTVTDNEIMKQQLHMYDEEFTRTMETFQKEIEAFKMNHDEF